MIVDPRQGKVALGHGFAVGGGAATALAKKHVNVLIAYGRRLERGHDQHFHFLLVALMLSRDRFRAAGNSLGKVKLIFVAPHSKRYRHS